jgi:dsRNA-specific ribonuclease
MEFLGDAVLDFGVVSILFRMNIRADEGQLSMMKVAITNNANLAIVAAKLRLHRWLIHSSDQLTAEIEALEDKLDIIDKASLIKASSQEPSSSISFAEEKILPHAEAEHVANSLMKSSKTLADAFEALIGAIYLDSQCSLEVIQDIVERLHLVPPAESWDFSLFT